MKGLLLFLMIVAGVAIAGGSAGATVEIGTEAIRNSIGASPVGRADVLLFSPADHLQDLFLPLKRAGKIGRLDLVIPGQGILRGENLAAWKRYVSGISPGADNGFQLDNGTIVGEIDGLHVSVIPVARWKMVPLTGPVIFDLSFLFGMYQDEVRTPFIDLPRRLLATLDDRKVPLPSVILWAANREEIPLSYGYIMKLAVEMFSGPENFRKGLPRKWEELRQAEHFAFFSAYEEASNHFDNYLKEEPEDPSVLYKIALMRFVDRDVEQGLRFLRRASRADRYYIRAYVEVAGNYMEKREFDHAERVLLAGLVVEPNDGGLKIALANVIVEQARKIFRGDPNAAEQRFQETKDLALPKDVREKMIAEWERIKTSPPEEVAPSGPMPGGHPRF